MTTYTAPLRDMRFVLHELLEVGQLAALPGYEEATPRPDRCGARGRRPGWPQNVLFPLNRSGDEEGCAFENGVVRTPKGFKEAYDQFAQAGWIGLAARPRVRRPGPAGGGQGRGRRDDLLGEPVVRHLSGPQRRRLQGDRAPCRRGAEGALSAEARGRPLERHDVPDRAAVRHRPRPDPDPRRAQGRRQLSRSPAPRSSSRPASTI